MAADLLHLHGKEKRMECLVDEEGQLEKWRYCWRLVSLMSTSKMSEIGVALKTKSQSSQWKHSTSSKSKKACQVCSNVKVMLTAFFDSRRVVHHEYGYVSCLPAIFFPIRSQLLSHTLITSTN